MTTDIRPAFKASAPLALILGLTGCQPPAAAPRPPLTDAAWVGIYVRTAPAPATLRITSAPGGLLDVAIDAAGPDRGAASAADCNLRARGRPEGDRLEAPVSPGRAGDLLVSAADVQTHGWRVSLTRGAGDAVTMHAVYEACGVGADLDGTYARGAAPAAAPPPSSDAPPALAGPRITITDQALGGVALGASPAEVRARFGGDKLRIGDDGAWTRFEVVGAGLAVGFDGEGRELKDGSDSLSQAGRTVGWDALKPDLKVTFLETTSPDLVTGDGVKVGLPLARASDRLGPATVRRERVGGAVTEWAVFATDAQSGVVYAVSAPGGGLAGVYSAGATATRVRPDAVIARIRVRAPLP